MTPESATFLGPVQSGRRLTGLLLRLAAALLVVSTVGRLALMTWQWPRLADLAPGTRLMALLYGLRMDLILVSLVLIPPLLLLALAPRPIGRVAAGLVRLWALAALLLVVFIEFATFPFFAQYDVRPNLMFMQYLDYPVEVAKLLWNEQRLNVVLSSVVLVALTVLWVRHGILSDAHQLVQSRLRHRALWVVPLALLLALGVRSSFGHRPANLSDALYSPNRVANELAKNSVYSIGYETYRARKDGERKAATYGSMPTTEAYARVQRLLGIEQAQAQRPLSRPLHVSHPAPRPRNLVIIVQESMSGSFAGHLGAERGVTPHIDALAKESITFMKLHATGTRSIQGLAAMSAGFLASPGEGILKRSKAQRDFFTVAAALKPLGYHASFMYGGEARFDDMKVWYLGNGFDEVIEQKDFVKPEFVATWGVSDEDLMRRAHERFTAHHAAGRPFVSVVFSQSNHAPFELPEGKIEWEPGVPKASVRNAVKYADYAVGQFFALAKASGYYRDTVFVVVADHTERTVGDDVVPVHAFHIPGLVHLAGTTAQRFEPIASQPDVLATALGMLGVPIQAPVMGTSIFKPDREVFALMNFNGNFGLLRGDHVAVLRAGKAPQTMRLDGKRLIEAPAQPELERDALSLVHVLDDVYERQAFR